MKKFFVFCVLLSLFPVCYGCGFKESVVQPDTQSYLWFNGNTAGAFAIVDKNNGFKIEPNYQMDDRGQKVKSSGKTLYEVKPGKHEVVVKRNNEIVVHRMLMISAGAIKEVKVP